MNQNKNIPVYASLIVILIALYLSEIYGLIPGNDIRVAVIFLIPIGIIFLYTVLLIPYLVYPKNDVKRKYVFMGLESFVALGIVIVHWIMSNCYA